MPWVCLRACAAVQGTMLRLLALLPPPPLLLLLQHLAPASVGPPFPQVAALEAPDAYRPRRRNRPEPACMLPACLPVLHFSLFLKRLRVA